MIEIKQVSKAFEEIEAVRKISLDIQSQNVFGMLGTRKEYTSSYDCRSTETR